LIKYLTTLAVLTDIDRVRSGKVYTSTFKVDRIEVPEEDVRRLTLLTSKQPDIPTGIKVLTPFIAGEYLVLAYQFHVRGPKGPADKGTRDKRIGILYDAYL
jgi:hypothetical protein